MKDPLSLESNGAGGFNCVSKLRNGYIKLVIRFPWVILLVTVLIVFVCGFIGIWFGDLPDFNNPSKGFVAKGTPISDRRIAKLKLERTVKLKEVYTLSDMLDYNHGYPEVVKTSIFKKRQIENVTFDFDLNGLLSKKGYIPCNPVLSDECAQIIIGSNDASKNSILDLYSIRILCSFVSNDLKTIITDKTIKTISIIDILNEYTNKTDCAKITADDLNRFSIHLNACVIYYAKTYHEITPLDLKQIPEFCLNRLLINTHKYIIDKFLRFELNEYGMRSVTRFTAIYLSVNKRDDRYLLDLYKAKLVDYKFNKDFLMTYNFQIKYELFNETILNSMFYLILAMMCILVITILYLKSILITFIILICVLFSLLISYFIYKIVFQLKFFPFINIMSIFLLIGLACDDVFVFYDTWLASKKKHFPGGNDNNNRNNNAFENPIYFVADNENNNNISKADAVAGENDAKLQCVLHKKMNYTFKHAINSIIVTTLTTAAVFLVNLSSNIITIRLFGLFSCLTILNDFLFMIILIPSILVLYSRYESKLNCFSKCFAGVKLECWTKTKLFYKKIFSEYLPFAIIKLRFVFIALFSLLGGVSLLWIFYKPGLKLPTSTTFQLFSNKNPFEYYDKHISVLSSSNGIFQYQLNSVPYLNLHYIFGVNLKENTFGSLWKPDDIPDDDEETNNPEHLIRFDSHFNFYNEHTQLWFQKFCHSLRYRNDSSAENSDDYIPTMEIFSKHKICLFDHLIPVLTSRCKAHSGENGEQSSKPSDVDSLCCGQQTFPFDEQLLKYCLSNKDFIKKYLIESELFFYEKLFFNKTNGFINAVQYQHLTLYTWNANYNDFEKFYAKIERFFSKQLKYSLFNLNKCSFYTSDFEFYDLQKSLYDTTIQSFLISLICVSVIMFIATGNLIVTLYSIFTIMFAISTTIGVLALLEWQLNVIESITIILAIGLSIDFTVHFGVMYCSILISQTRKQNKSKDVVPKAKTKPPQADKFDIVKQSVSNLGSAVLMASLTTFLAGASMMPSPLLSFQLYGTFLMLVMLFSVTFAFFLFLPLLAVIGPTDTLFQWSWNKLFSKCCAKTCKSKKPSAVAKVPKSGNNKKLGNIRKKKEPEIFRV